MELETVVLDAGALLATSFSFQTFLTQHPEARFVTTEAVVKEIKDSESRHRLEQSMGLGKLEVISYVERKYVDRVSRFAFETGDLYALSATDIGVIALSLQMEVELHGEKFVQKHPKPPVKLSEVESKKQAQDDDSAIPFAATRKVVPFPVQKILSSLAVTVMSPEDEQKAKIADDDLLTVKTIRDQSKTSEETVVATSDTSINAAVERHFNAEGEGEWITEANVHEQRVTDASAPPASQAAVVKEESGLEGKSDVVPTQSGVVCITTDFSMQNVLLQLGLRLWSVGGMQIQSVRTWILQCYTCHTIERDNSRRFCPGCGGQTLMRASVSINPRGELVYRGQPRHKRINKRGTQYAIPKIKGGRRNNDIKLREDTVYRDGFTSQINKQKKQSADAYADALEFGMAGPGKTNTWHQVSDVGYGRKNPNVVNKNKGKNKRNHRRK